MTDLIAPLVVGYYLKQKHLASEGFMNKLISFNVVGVYTFLALLSFWVIPLNFELALIPLYGTLFVIFPGVLGAVFGKRFHNSLVRGSYMASAMLANVSTLGGVCSFILFDEKGYAYSQLIGVCQNFLMVLLVFPLAQFFYSRHKGGDGEGGKFSLWRSIFSWNQLSVVGMIAGLFLNANQVARPEILGSIFQSLVHVGAWIALLPVGYIINFSKAQHYRKHVLDLTAIRFVIVPVFVWFTSRMIFSDPVLNATLFILATAPTAINAVITARLYKLRTDLAVASFIQTTAVYLLIGFPALFFLMKS